MLTPRGTFGGPRRPTISKLDRASILATSITPTDQKAFRVNTLCKKFKQKTISDTRHDAATP